MAAIPKIQPYKKLTHGSDHSILMAPNKDAGIVVCGNSEVYSEGYYSVHDKQGEITVFFSLESLGEHPSRVYPAIRCYTNADDHPSSEITSSMAGAGFMSAPVIIHSVISPTKFSVGYLGDKFDDFSGLSDDTNRNLGIAFFYDGDVSKNFDYFIQGIANKPFFETFTEGDKEYLVLADAFTLPKDVLMNMIYGKTVFRLQKSLMSYVYPLGDFFVPKTISSYSFKINVTPDWLSGPTGKYLRMGTRYIRIGFLTNYGQTSANAKLMIKNFHIAQID